MGATVEQKLEAAIQLIKRTDDVYILMDIANAAHDRLNKLLEE